MTLPVNISYILAWVYIYIYIFLPFYSAPVGRCMILAMIFLAVCSLVHIIDSKVVAAFHMTRNRSQ